MISGNNHHIYNCDQQASLTKGYESCAEQWNGILDLAQLSSKHDHLPGTLHPECNNTHCGSPHKCPRHGPTDLGWYLQIIQLKHKGFYSIRPTTTAAAQTPTKPSHKGHKAERRWHHCCTVKQWAVAKQKENALRRHKSGHRFAATGKRWEGNRKDEDIVSYRTHSEQEASFFFLLSRLNKCALLGGKKETRQIPADYIRTCQHLSETSAA